MERPDFERQNLRHEHGARGQVQADSQLTICRDEAVGDDFHGFKCEHLIRGLRRSEESTGQPDQAQQ
ncbi:MAG: hypothetical protein EA425_14115 [Puniceicoccaceae bacterium]|nr:MAG: hypothetical protein EA425_14115 [Puniceicoccaceae bacterium]